MNIVNSILSQSKPIEEVVSLNSKTFKKKYFDKKTPIVIRGGANSWGATKNWNLDFFLNLKDDDNDKEVKLLTGNFIQDDNRYKKGSFKDYIKRLKDAENNNISFTDYLTTLDIFRYYPYLKKDIDFLLFENHTLINDITAWIGPSGTISGFHADVAKNMYAQIKGRKMFILCSTKFNKNMYPSDKYIYEAVASQVDINNFDEKRFPKFKDIEFQSVILEPGDVLHVPQNWWHYVQALESSISISNFGFTKIEKYTIKFKGRIMHSLHKRGYYKPKNCFCCGK